MITKSDIENMASLARIAITDAEKERLTQDATRIIEYIDQLNGVVISEDIQPDSRHTNVVRGDQSPHSSREFSAIRDEFPDQYDGYVKVPKVL